MSETTLRWAPFTQIAAGRGSAMFNSYTFDRAELSEQATHLKGKASTASLRIGVEFEPNAVPNLLVGAGYIGQDLNYFDFNYKDNHLRAHGYFLRLGTSLKSELYKEKNSFFKFINAGAEAGQSWRTFGDDPSSIKSMGVFIDGGACTRADGFCIGVGGQFSIHDGKGDVLSLTESAFTMKVSKRFE